MPTARIVIIGGGIIGCTSAYYITRHPRFAGSDVHITLLEASTIAAGASGKAGGLVAKWAYPSDLASVSFQEHSALAERHGGSERWGWREVLCGELECHADGPVWGMTGPSLRDRGKAKATSCPPDLDWIDDGLIDAYKTIAGDTAQVHPYEFTMSMIALAKEQAGDKLEVLEGVKVVNMERDIVSPGGDERITGVVYSQEDSDPIRIPAETVLLAAGPWSPQLFPGLPVSTARAHSIVFEPATPVTPYVLFTSTSDGKGTLIGTPEIYSRPQNRVYVCGPGDDEPLPDLASNVKVSPSAIASLRNNVSSISATLREGRVETEQACYLPNGGPIVGKVDKISGLIIATGHTVWGICNAPATGKAVSELMMDGALSKTWRLSKLEPKRFMRS